MKKTYNNPSLEVVKLNIAHSLLAGSEKVNFGGDVETTEGAVSRESDLDDDF